MSSFHILECSGIQKQFNPFPLRRQRNKIHLGYAWSQDLKSLPLFIKQVACT
jgi:hypothetical protein